MLHLTVSNKPHPGLDLLKESATGSVKETRVLGMGNTTPIGHRGKGFGLKLSLLKAELLLLPPMTKILFTDAYDVLLNGSSKQLEDWIDNNRGKVLFAAERIKWPDKNLMYPSVNLPFPYLNSGVFAGRAQDILELLNEPFDNSTDDQGYYSKQYVRGSSIVLDHTAKFFLCLCGVSVPHTLPLVTHLNNGLTRVKHMRTVVKKLLPNRLHLANAVVWREVSYYVKCIAFVALFILLVWTLSYMWN